MSKAPGVPPFTVKLWKPLLTPVYAVDARLDTPGLPAFLKGADRYAAGTSMVDILDPAGKRIKQCLLFVPGSADLKVNKIHVFWSPGGAPEGALTGALRSAADKAHWILFVVPGPPEEESKTGWVTISADEIAEALRKAGRPPAIHALRLSAHSRGHRGLAHTLNDDLLVRHSGKVTPPQVGPGMVERVVNFDAYYSSFAAAIGASGIPASKVFGYHVTIGGWAASPSQTVELAPVITGLRAIAYSRLIGDAARIGTRLPTPPPAKISSRLLKNLPTLGEFSSRPKPRDFRAFCTNKTNSAPIANCMKDEQSTDMDKAVKGPLIEFVNDNNLAGIGGTRINKKTGKPEKIRYSANVWAHHLFVCEFAHEVTDADDPKP